MKINWQCLFGNHVWKHYLITSIAEYNDDRGGPANRMLKTIDRKCMNCGRLRTEVIRVKG